MAQTETIDGVLLSAAMDLKSFYGLDAAAGGGTVRLFNPDEVTDPQAIRFAVCWLPSKEAFAPYPNLEMAMSIGAGVDALMSHPGLGSDTMICRVRDPHQADLMAGYAVHEALRHLRDFPKMEVSQSKGEWAPLPMEAPEKTRIAVLGNGTMGAAVTRALSVLGFSVSVACRRQPKDPLDGIIYHAGEGAVQKAAEDADVLINVLPLTGETENILNADLFDRLADGAWLIQIGRGEHLHEADFEKALDSGKLAGASLDVFRTEPLPSDHPYWQDSRLRITPHVASDSTPSVVADQVIQSGRELAAGKRPELAIDRSQGY
ncbi:hydroxyacid dehydrogenase [Rhodobacterales bacterium]|nr:hydroxyacid dehydrogenase [Rhodobacterales bacterium]